MFCWALGLPAWEGSSMTCRSSEKMYLQKNHLIGWTIAWRSEVNPRPGSIILVQDSWNCLDPFSSMFGILMYPQALRLRVLPWCCDWKGGFRNHPASDVMASPFEKWFPSDRWGADAIQCVTKLWTISVDLSSTQLAGASPGLEYLQDWCPSPTERVCLRPMSLSLQLAHHAHYRCSTWDHLNRDPRETHHEYHAGVDKRSFKLCGVPASSIQKYNTWRMLFLKTCRKLNTKYIFPCVISMVLR